jgi:hypothetical protein
MATREEMLREMIADSRRKIERHTINIAEWEMELRAAGADIGGPDSPGANGGGTNAPGLDPLSVVRPFEFATKSQPEAIKIFLERYGYPLTTDQLMAGLDKGGLKVGGTDPLRKKNNLATILTRCDGVVRVGRGAWSLGTKRPKAAKAAPEAKATEAT